MALNTFLAICTAAKPLPPAPAIIMTQSFSSNGQIFVNANNAVPCPFNNNAASFNRTEPIGKQSDSLTTDSSAKPPPI